MSRYAHGSSLFFFFFLFFISMVLCQLPQNQKNAMEKLSTVLNETNPNPCSWKGVTCTESNSSITHLSFSGLSLSGSDFLVDLCQIDTLQSLDLSNNHLNSIPDEFIRDCGEIIGFNMLNFSKNMFSGFLPALHGFVRLQFLDLSFNLLSGNIGFQLDGLVGLRSLNLSNNQFNGPVPTHLGKSLFLEELQLSVNGFQGRIPEELMNYRNLTLLDLSRNQISGSVTDRIGELSKLKTLLLSSNNLSGQVPESLSKIETLSRFGAYENGFTGNVPLGISRYLKYLDLSYNKLSGLMPSDLLSSPNLESVDLSYNLLEGPIPVNISQSLFRLRLGSNSLNNSLPFVADGMLLKLIYLELDNNSLSGEIPRELGNCQNLQLLNLAQNQLSGPLPKELGNLLRLQVMKLQSNQLTGEIPDQLFRLQNLLILNISRNSLSGSIPPAISGLLKLSILNLQDNKLNGTIPDSIGSLNLLLELQLGNNNLSGKIPMMPPKLQISLNLSRNDFDGHIPETLSRLSALEVLDLSNNRFSGEIPKFLNQMGSLTLLLLSNNQLSGTRPKFQNPWLIVDTDGNKDLITISTNSTPPPILPKKRHSSAVVVVVAVAGAALAVGVITVILLLVSKRVYRVNDGSQHSGEEFPLRQVISGHLITPSSIHRGNIDFNIAMEAIGNSANIMLKTRFCTYYKVDMASGTSYYVKKLNWSDKIFQLGSHDRFGQELEVLGKLRNSSIMIPLAYVLTADNAYLFYEYAQKGALFDFLHGSLRSDLDWTSRYSIAIGVAQGLAFLHGCTSDPVILFDLSAKSILLKSLKEPLIGDIELCKVIDPSKSTGSLSAIAGTVGYIPPEYAYTMRVTMPGNVYSFGVILLELLTGKPAVSEGRELAKWVVSNSMQHDNLDRILDSSISKRSLGARSQMLSILRVALSCVSVSPEARPKAKDVLSMLLNSR
ncbi:hypothetical protein HHK36_009096 [Tetracentron sinense]|uniref:Protein kinase domain-containing protein n=1 Tax=Tetracentron sinense TaxID=13715 RepID=A0A834ZFL7_TETSI|nr:hypothetical protein HHK36_009096 [Tetracentron sinense]